MSEFNSQIMSYKIKFGHIFLNTSNHQIISNEKVIFFHDQQRVWLLVCWVFITFGCLPEVTEAYIRSCHRSRHSFRYRVENLLEYFENFRMTQASDGYSYGEKLENIKCEKYKIYISDGLTLFAFSEEGELALCLEKRGEAPDEYSGISDFVIDGENIIILDRNQQKT